MGDAPPPYSSTTPAKLPPYNPEPGLPSPESYASPQPGSQNLPPQGFVSAAPATRSVAVPTQVVVVQAGSCPVCKMGVITEQFTLCGICLAIFFFPLGLICCFMMRSRRCSNCRAIVV